MDTCRSNDEERPLMSQAPSWDEYASPLLKRQSGDDEINHYQGILRTFSNDSSGYRAGPSSAQQWNSAEPRDRRTNQAAGDTHKLSRASPGEYGNRNLTAQSVSRQHHRVPGHRRTKSAQVGGPTVPSSLPRPRTKTAEVYNMIPTSGIKHHSNDTPGHRRVKSLQQEQAAPLLPTLSGEEGVNACYGAIVPPGERTMRRAKPASAEQLLRTHSGDEDVSIPSGYVAISSGQPQHQRGKGHRKTKSGDSLGLSLGLPPISPTKAPRHESSKKPGHRRVKSASAAAVLKELQDDQSRTPRSIKSPLPGSRNRTYSSEASKSSLQQGVELYDGHDYPLPRRPLRARADSASSIGSVGSIGASVTSIGSVTSDITKSSFFKGVTESGMMKFHLPIDSVRLIMNPALQPGMLCKPFDDDEKFTEYHDLQPVPSFVDVENLWSDEQLYACTCNCTCNHCSKSMGKKAKLPPLKYLLTVDDDLYKRVLSEVAQSSSTPCGLFFCGHHEDVSRPSIFIALTIVVLVFVALFVGTMEWAYD